MEFLPYIISVLSLTIVIIQFVVKRKDDKITYLNNKKFEVYTHFMTNFSMLQIKKDIIESGIKIMNDDTIKVLDYPDNELLKMKFKEHKDFTRLAASMVESLTVIYNRDVDIPQFLLLSTKELITEMQNFKLQWRKFQNKFYIEAKEYSNCYNFKIFIRKFNDSLNNLADLGGIEISYDKIIPIMRKELGIKND